MFVRFLTVLFVLVHGATLVYALALLVDGFSPPFFPTTPLPTTPLPTSPLPLLGLALIAAAPLVQLATKVDRLQVPHHKVRLPRISLAVFAGLALILLTAGKNSEAIWLAFLNIGLFLLDTYWLKNPAGGSSR